VQRVDNEEQKQKQRERETERKKQEQDLGDRYPTIHRNTYWHNESHIKTHHADSIM